MGKEDDQIILIFIVSAVFVVLLVILLILFLLIYQKRIVTQENRLQKLENERQQVLLKATIEGQERERERLAKDLHDGIGSLLSGLSLNLKFQKNKESPESKQADFLEEACKLVDEGIKNVRLVSHDLMPTTLENFGLISAMNECCEPVNNSSKIKVKINVVSEIFHLPKDISLGLLRVFQELLQNTIKHSEASQVNTVVEFNTNFIQLDYSDNGKGFDFDINNSKGLGIKSMESRIQALEGIFQINKKSKEGFKAHIKVPIMFR